MEGTITHLTKFGAFARLGDDLEGLIHVSELSEQRIAHPKEAVKEGDVVTLRVIKIDPERRRIGLSLRKVDSPAYADLDWKMALSGEVGETKETPVAEEPQASEEVEKPVEEQEPVVASTAPVETETLALSVAPAEAETPARRNASVEPMQHPLEA